MNLRIAAHVVASLALAASVHAQATKPMPTRSRGPSTASIPVASAPAESQNIKDVRALLTLAQADLKAGKEDKALDLMPANVAKETKPLLDSYVKLAAKGAKLDELLAAKGIEVSKSYRDAAADAVTMAPGISSIVFIEDKTRPMDQPGDVVIVMTGRGMPGEYKKVGGKWVLLDQPFGPAMRKSLGPVIDATDKMIDEMTQGVTSGKITKDNIDKESAEALKGVTAAMAKLHDSVMEEMAKQMPATKPATAPEK